MRPSHPRLTITLAVLAFGLLAFAPPPVLAQEPDFTAYFNFRDCGGFETTGSNPYFVLEPGFQLVLAGEEDGESIDLEITVLDETERIGGVRARVVEEREWIDGELFEVARNYFVICRRSNSAIYLGEDVDFYEDGEIVDHHGSWRAGTDGARAGIQMPGTPLLGARYYQEIAPGIALDRAELVSLTEVVDTPAGRFERSLLVRETTALEPDTVEFKLYAPGIGLISDGELELTAYGFVGGSGGSGDDDDDDDDEGE